VNFKENESPEKLRGGYYTPLRLANYLVKWIGETKPKSILEPSAGDGIFIEALGAHLSNAEITAIELDASEASKAYTRGKRFSCISVEVHCSNFLEWYLSQAESAPKYNAIVGNPPFIRYQYMSKEDQNLAEIIFKKHGLKFTKHTNIWVPFIVASISLLSAGGRIAMIIPSEILHVLHAQSLRTYLGEQCDQISIIDPTEIWFGNTLQGVVMLCATKKQNSKKRSRGLGIIPVQGEAFLDIKPSKLLSSTNYLNGKTVEGKWTHALLTAPEYDLYHFLKSEAQVSTFRDVAKVDVGIVTGANKFFLVDDETVEKYGLQQWAHPMFGRSEHCPGIIYDQSQHSRNAEIGKPSNFVWFDDVELSELPRGAQEYIQLGEAENLHTRYKCRIRKPWYRVPSVSATEIGMLKRCHNIPRLIHNTVGAYTTDTAYRIRPTGINPKRFVYSFINSLTALSADLEGRHYGGGVLELVPSEIEKVIIPLPKSVRPKLRQLDTAFRASSIEHVLETQDNELLGAIGLTSAEISLLQGARERLKNRRQRNPTPTN
jgi:adenine-specific DNA-methyltransferase